MRAAGADKWLSARRAMSWVLIGMGLLVILRSAVQYGWAVFATDRQTEQAQERLLEQFEETPTVERPEPVPGQGGSRPPPRPVRSEPEDDVDEAAVEASGADGWAAAGPAEIEVVAELDRLPHGWRLPPYPEQPPQPAVGEDLRQVTEQVRRTVFA